MSLAQESIAPLELAEIQGKYERRNVTNRQGLKYEDADLVITGTTGSYKAQTKNGDLCASEEAPIDVRGVDRGYVSIAILKNKSNKKCNNEFIFLKYIIYKDDEGLADGGDPTHKPLFIKKAATSKSNSINAESSSRKLLPVMGVAKLAADQIVGKYHLFGFSNKYLGVSVLNPEVKMTIKKDGGIYTFINAEGIFFDGDFPVEIISSEEKFIQIKISRSQVDERCKDIVYTLIPLWVDGRFGLAYKLSPQRIAYLKEN
jgi:hypothetical protein